MRLTWRAGLHLAAAGSAITLITMIGSVPVSASPGGHPGPAGLLPAVRGIPRPPTVTTAMAKSDDILDSAQQFSAVRTAPGDHGQPGRVHRGVRRRGQARSTGGRWREVTNQPYNSDAVGYRDPTWSNSSGGARPGGRADDRARRGRQCPLRRGGRRRRVAVDRRRRALDAGLRPAEQPVHRGAGRRTPPTTRSGSAPARRTPARTPTPATASSGPRDGGRTWQLVGNSLPNHLVYRITFDGARARLRRHELRPAPAHRA